MLLGAVVMHAPSLGMGFFFDDHAHQLVLDGAVNVEHMKPWSLFDFGHGSDWKDVDGLLGNMPWWISPDFSLRFLRPLTSLSLWLDHAVYGSNAVGYHATNLVLYLFTLLAARALYRALGLGPRAALGAMALFATTNGGWMAVGWLANRNAVLVLLTSVLALLALEQHAKWGRGRALAVALGCGLLACASKESGVAAFAVIALRLFLIRQFAMDTATRQWAIAGAGGSLAMAALYVLALPAAGYGASLMNYAPPWRNPTQYLMNLGVLFTAGSLELIAPVSIDTTEILTGSVVTSVVLGAGVALPAFAYIIRKLGARRSLFFAGTAVLFTVPQGAAGASDRLLFCAAFGTAGLLAMFMAEVYTQHRGSRASRADRTIAIALLISAGPLSAISGLGHSAALAVIANATRASVLATEVGDPSLGQRQLVVLQAANTLLPASLGPLWRRESEDLDLRFEILHASGRAFEWTREDERTFSMRSLEDPFLSRAMESLYRTPGDSLKLGQRWPSESCVVEAIALEPDGGLRAIRVRFDRSLDAPELRFLIEREGRLSVIAPPKIGESITVERPLVGTFGP